MMNTKYARLNLQLIDTEGLAAAMQEFQQYLHDAADLPPVIGPLGF